MNHLNILTIYANAFSEGDHLVYLLDEKGVLIDCNNNLLQFLKINRVELYSMQSIYHLIHKKMLWNTQKIEHFQQEDIDAIIYCKRTLDTYSFTLSDDCIQYFYCLRIPLFDNTGNLLGLMVVFKDTLTKTKLLDQLKITKKNFKHNPIMSNSNVIMQDNELYNNINVLIIEDNLVSQIYAKKIFANCQAITDVATNPMEALNLFKPGKYNLVLMDLNLAYSNGYKITAHLRQKEQRHSFRVPIIALTSSDPTEVGFDCDDSDMDGILQKPLNIEQARQLIKRFVNHFDNAVRGLREFK